MLYFHSDFVTLGAPYGQSAMKQCAMKPISAAKKMLLLGGYFASIWDKEGQRRYMEKLSIIGGFDPYEQDDVDVWPSTTYIATSWNVFVSQSKSIHWGRPDEL